jgi:predicted N-acetyltransferase YhbS
MEHTADFLLPILLSKHNRIDASRTFVVADPQAQVCGYYAMAAGVVARKMATSSVRQNMPEPVAEMVLARLAVDMRAQGNKLGGALLQDAVNRAVAVSQNAGVRACWCTR